MLFIYLTSDFGHLRPFCCLLVLQQPQKKSSFDFLWHCRSVEEMTTLIGQWQKKLCSDNDQIMTLYRGLTVCGAELEEAWLFESEASTAVLLGLDDQVASVLCHLEAPDYRCRTGSHPHLYSRITQHQFPGQECGMSTTARRVKDKVPLRLWSWDWELVGSKYFFIVFSIHFFSN